MTKQLELLKKRKAIMRQVAEARLEGDEAKATQLEDEAIALLKQSQAQGFITTEESYGLLAE